jgi:hypothetical protein
MEGCRRRAQRRIARGREENGGGRQWWSVGLSSDMYCGRGGEDSGGGGG